MTNPNSIIGTNAGYNGRTSSRAFNDVLAALSRGVLSGWECAPSAGMTVTLGGNGTDRDVAIAEDNAGNRTSINNRLGTPVSVELSSAPATNNRIDVIVAYAENSIQGSGASDVDFPSGTGIIAIEGTIAANPTAPDDTAIRDAITADGATGSSAFYVVLAEILVGTGVTSIGSGVITQGDKAQIASSTASDLISAIKQSMNITQFDTQDTVGTFSGINISDKALTLAQSADGSVFKFYGRMYYSNTTGSSKNLTPTGVVPGLTGVYGRDTGLVLNTAPTTAFQITPAGQRNRFDSSKQIQTYPSTIAVGTDGHIYIFISTSSSGLSLPANETERQFWEPCVYYNTNFGDSGGES